MLIRLTPKSTRFGDDFVASLAHWMLARLSPLHFGCCHEPVYSPSYFGATACPLIPSNDRNALNALKRRLNRNVNSWRYDLRYCGLTPWWQTRSNLLRFVYIFWDI